MTQLLKKSQGQSFKYGYKIGKENKSDQDINLDFCILQGKSVVSTGGSRLVGVFGKITIKIKSILDWLSVHNLEWTLKCYATQYICNQVESEDREN